MTAATILSTLWRVAKISIPIPLALIVAAGLWVWLDKASAIRLAVDEAVKELVAGADLAAMKAERDAAQAIADASAESARRAAQAAAAAVKARDELDTALDEAERINTELKDRIDDITATPPPAGCDADERFIGGLRNN